MSDEQNEWITSLRPRNERTWLQIGQIIAREFGLGDDFNAIYKHHRDEGASKEHAVKRSLRDLQLEYDLDYVGEYKRV